MVKSSDTIEFDIDAVPYPFKRLPRHYDMVELMTPEELRLAHNERSRKYYAANRASLVAASFAEFRQKNVFRKPLQCGCGEQYERFAEYQKHINQCKHRHFGIRKAKDVSLETPGVSKLSCLQDTLRYDGFKSLFGRLSLTSPIRQSAILLYNEERKQERLDRLEKELVLLNSITEPDLQTNYRISVIQNAIIEIQEEVTYSFKT